MISTHVLDLSRGSPAAGVAVALDRLDAGSVTRVHAASTDADGRVRDLTGGEPVLTGTYRITFGTGEYFSARSVDAFHPHVVIEVRIADRAQDYHVPVLLSPFGYTTYRGS